MAIFDVLALCPEMDPINLPQIGTIAFAYVKFEARQESDVKTNSEGICNSRKRECRHDCPHVRLTDRSVNMAIDSPLNPVYVKPEPFVE